MVEPLNKKNLYLAIDQGGHSSRTVVFDASGRQVAISKFPVAESYPREEWVEQDAEELIYSIRQSIEQVIEQLGNRARDIVAAGLATQRSSMVCWNRMTGKALYPVISWQDRRAEHYLESLEPKAEEIHKKTGLFLSPHYGASKMRWCLDEVAAVRQAMEEGHLVMGPLASFLIFSLLTEKPLLADPANASRTQLWNLRTKNWDKDLLEFFGIQAACLPECVPTRYDFGTLIAGDMSVPLQIVNGDQSAALFSYGPLQPDTAYINIGTGAFVSRSSGNYAPFGRRLLAGIVFQDSEKSSFVLEGTVNGAGSALDWVRSEFGLEDFIDELPEWLATIDNPPVFLNGVAGLGSPFWIPNFKSRFEGQGSTEAKVVAVVESIIFLLESNLQEMLNLSSPPLQIQISGGMSKLDGLCQRLSDLSGLPVYRPVETEATARGTAYLLINQVHDWPETDIGVWFKPGNNKAIIERYEKWRGCLLADIRK